jgi:hypothetical protein
LADKKYIAANRERVQRCTAAIASSLPPPKKWLHEATCFGGVAPAQEQELFSLEDFLAAQRAPAD